ncbi:MAG: hypothetical protein KDB00_00500, partial [Planctomycetales bacterium]|nr:hypothetical protein [Planctomycetales bacterium]
MLAATPWDLAEVASAVSTIRPTGVTVIVGEPGNEGDIGALSQSITDVADTSNPNLGAWEFHLGTAGISPVGPRETVSGEVIVSVDWGGPELSSSIRQVEAMGDALFNTLIKTGWVETRQSGSSTIPLHMIGFGAGTSVVSEMVERLARIDVTVDQVTLLDPYDLASVPGAGGKFPRDEIVTAPAVMDTLVWSNVGYADVYYQTESASGGRPIPGAFNYLVNVADSVDHPGGHSGVLDFYTATVGTSASVGFSLSRIGGGETLRQGENYYDAGQDHAYSPTELVNRSTGQPNAISLASIGRLSSDVVRGRWAPSINAFELYNGDFQAATSTGQLIGWNTGSKANFPMVDGANQIVL